MKRSQLKEVSTEIMVGSFMFMILLALGFFTIILSYENIFQKYYPLEVHFEHVRGLRQGDNVFLRGVMIGRVRDLEVKSDGVLVTTSLLRPVELREGYSIDIVPSSVLGGQHLAINEGPPHAPVLPETTAWKGNRPVDLLDEATEAIKLVRDALDQGSVLQNLEGTMANLNKITSDLSEGRGTIGRLLVDDAVYQNLVDISVGLREVTSQLEQGEGTLGALLHDDELYRNLTEVSQRLVSGQGMLGRLLSDDESLYEDIAATASAVRETAARIHSGQGSLGRLMADDELYEEAKMVLHEIRAAVDDFRETAPITTFTSIFFGAF